MENIKMEVDQFKRDLESVPYLNYKLRKIEVQLVELAAKLYEVSAPPYDREPGQRNPRYNNLLVLIDKEERLIKERDEIERRINRYRSILNMCSKKVKDALVYKYVLKESWSKISDEMFIDRTTIERKCTRELEKVLNN